MHLEWQHDHCIWFAVYGNKQMRRHRELFGTFDNFAIDTSRGYNADMAAEIGV